MGITPTQEQQAAREVFAAGRDLALVAGAGTGKTSTLELMGAATRKRGLYVSFNKAIAQDASRRFGSNVQCRTAHSLAFGAVGRRYGDRLSASARIPAKQTARLLGITDPIDVGSARISVAHQARLVMNMVRRFCFTTDRQVMARHLERVNGLDTEGQNVLAAALLPYAVTAWKDLQSPKGRLRFEHDHYLKMWALSEPTLPAEFVLLDEAQDTNPVLEEVFLAQHAQRVCVGDPAQQIYAWRFARDVMSGFPAEQLQLTQSFRFGPAIAEVANRWLVHAESDMRLAGCGPADSRVGPSPHAEAVLCRGNADAMREVLAYLEQGVPVALAGGGAPLRRIAEAAQDLKAGRRTSHPELFLFSSWSEVREYAENDKAGQDLKAIVKLVDTYGPDLIIDAVDQLAPEEKARVVVSTAHKAKGRQWSSVRIGDGFSAPSVDDDGIQRLLDPAEARLVYVAVTRAQHLLDPAGIDWIDAYENAITAVDDDATLAGLNLTAQLKHPTSPIARFMADHLPNPRPVIGDYLDRLSHLPRPVQPVDVQRPAWAALGHAIDLRLRLSLGGHLGPAVDHGIALLATNQPIPGLPVPARTALHAAGRALLAAADTYRHQPTGLDDDQEDDRIRLCFVAGYFEDIYRTGEVRRFSVLADATPATTLKDLTAAVPGYVLEDIRQQMHLADEPFRAFRALPEAERICGPIFAGSSDIGGADADFVLGRALLDCKATTQPRRLGRDELYQLAGYLLLDYDDTYAIDHVGLYLSRQGGLITWPVTDFLHRMGATKPLNVLRRHLCDHLQQAAHTHPTPNPERPSVSEWVARLLGR
jgi:hypothetical protein